MIEEVREYSVDGWKDWTRLEIKTDEGTTKRNYRSPGGTVISQREWLKHSSNESWKSQGYIPENILTPINTPKPGGPAFLPSRAASMRVVEGTISPPPNQSIPISPDEERLQQQQHTQSSYQQDVGRKAQPSSRPPVSPPPPPAAGDIPNDEPVFIAPDPKLDQSRSRAGNRATPRELADGFYISISIVTSIVALILREPSLSATDLEAQAIAVPAANLFAKSKFNEKFGRYIASSGDYQLLGYALWMYGNRVISTIQAKKAQRQPTQQQYMPPSQSNGHTPPATPAPMGASLPPSVNLSGKTPPGVGRQW